MYRGRLVRYDERAAVAEEICDPAAVGHDARDAGRRRFGGDHAEVLVRGRERENVGVAVQLGGVVHRAEKVHPVFEPKLFAQREEFLRRPVPVVRADDRELRAVQGAHRFDQELEPLSTRDAADGEHEWRLVAEPESPAQ